MTTFLNPVDSSARPFGSLRTGPQSLAIAAENRLWIEAACLDAAHTGIPLVLPAGELWLDTHLILDARYNGLTVRGVPGRTSLRNVYGGGGARTLLVWSPWEQWGVVWEAVLTRVSARVWDVMDQPEKLSQMFVGQWGHCAVRDGFMSPGGQQRCTLAAVVAIAGTRVTFDRDVPEQCNRWCGYAAGSAPCKEALDGSRELVLTAPTTAMPPGRLAYVCAGPLVANGTTGEYRTVTATDGKSLRLDRPLRRAMPSAVVVPIAPVRDVAIEDVIFAPPPHPQVETVFVYQAFNIAFRRCRFDVAQGPVATCATGELTFEDCSSNSALLVNTTHDLRVVGGRWGGFVFEEACTDCEIDGVRIVPLGNGVGTNDSSNRAIRVCNCRIEGAGAVVDPLDPNKGRYCPLIFGGPDCEVGDTRIAGSSNQSYVGGDRLTLRGVISDAPVVLTGGRNVLIDGCRFPKLTARAGTTGVLANSFGTVELPPTGWSGGRR